LNIDALRTQELHELPPMRATLPVAPEDRIRSGQGRGWRRRGSALADRPEHGTDAAGFLRSSAIALTLLSEWAGTTLPDAGGIDYAHAAITFRSPFLGIERKTRRTA